MKKIILSAAVAAMAFSTSAMAADKGIDITTNGQAVVYYQTSETNAVGSPDLFDKEASSANVGVQLDLGADLGNNFTFGSQLSYLGTAGLENNLVLNTRQTSALTNTSGSGLDQANDTTDQIMLTKIFVAKKIANTTLKIGRQELPKSLSPLAYTEGWNVFKNTFDAIVAVNTDLPKTTIVAAYVGGTTGHDLSTVSTIGNATGDEVGATLPLANNGGAYMLTAQTTLIPMTTLTASYYRVSHVADAMWIDAQVKPMDMLNIGLQYGNLDLDNADDTTTYGIKATVKPMDALSITAAYTSVSDDGALTVTNLGTGVKSPLYTQMVVNQSHIAALDNDTWMLSGSYSLGDMGTITARYANTDDDATASSDFDELDIIYSVKAGGVKYFAAYVAAEHGNAETDVVRLWARYNF